MSARRIYSTRINGDRYKELLATERRYKALVENGWYVFGDTGGRWALVVGEEYPSVYASGSTPEAAWKLNWTERTGNHEETEAGEGHRP